jgi:hypothetical protein
MQLYVTVMNEIIYLCRTLSEIFIIIYQSKLQVLASDRHIKYISFDH